MKSKWKPILRIGLALAMVIGVTACASAPRPFTYHDDREEKPGPGLFSGEAGGFVITGGAEEKPTGAETEQSVNQ